MVSLMQTVAIVNLHCIIYMLDINECMMPVAYSCPDGMVCRNVEGWYDCDCPPGTTANNLTGCVCELLMCQMIAT